MNFIKQYSPFIFFVFSFTIFLKAFLLPGYPDFLVHYYSPLAILVGQSPYTFSYQAFFPNVYPPVTIIFFFPFIIFPLIIAEKIWFLLSLVFLLLSVYFIFQIADKKFFSKLGLIVLGFCFFSFPVKFTFGMGQINTLILFLTVLSIFLLTKKKNILSSFFLSLSIAMKFFPVFLPFYFLIKKQFKFLASLIVVFGLLHLLIYVFFPNIVIYFYSKVIFDLIGGWKTDYYNQSLTGFLGRIVSDNQLRDFLRISLSLFFTLISFLVIFKTRFNKKLTFFHYSILITLNLIINNFSWQHHFIFMIFPFLIIFFYGLDRKDIKVLVTLLFGFFLISINIKNPLTFPIFLTSHALYGVIIMWILQIYIINNFQQLQPDLPKGRRH